MPSVHARRSEAPAGPKVTTCASESARTPAGRPGVGSANEGRLGGRGGRRRPVRRSRLSPVRRGDAVGPARGARRRAPELQRRQRRPPPHRGARAAPRARDGGALPPSRAVHRAERAGGGQRGPRRLRPGLPVRRPAPVHERRPAARRRVRQRHAARRPRLLLARARRVEAMHAAIRAATTVIVQLNRAMPRTLGDSFIHVDDIDLAVEVDVPPYELRRPGRSATSSDGSARTSRSSSPTARRSSWGSARSRRRRRSALTRQARPRHPHRDVHRRGRRPRRGRRRHRRRARSATAARS